VTATPVRTVFLGSGGFGVRSLRRLAGHPDVALVGVVTAPPRPSGRGGTVTATPIHEAATALDGPPVLTPARLRDEAAIASVLALAPELLVLADYGRLVPDALLEPRHGALNLHPSLLPRHRGASPIPATILAGDAETGVSLMRMDAGLDTGPLIAQVHVALSGRETSPTLESELEILAADLLADELGPWLRGERPTRPQAEAGATLTRPLTREDGRLDPTRPAAELDRQVRALQPWPGSFFETADGRVVVEVAVASAATDGAVGTLTADGLVTRDGLLRLDRVRPAGGRSMPWADYLRGRPNVVGRSVSAAGR
jgi:methionyl-tRNA formyltransferase